MRMVTPMSYWSYYACFRHMGNHLQEKDIRLHSLLYGKRCRRVKAW